MFRRKLNLNVSIIACGDAGQKIGEGIIKELDERGVKLKSLLITTGVGGNSAITQSAIKKVTPANPKRASHSQVHFFISSPPGPTFSTKNH